MGVPASDPADAVPHLDGLIRGYLHQDMDLEAEGVPEAIAAFAQAASPAEKAAVRTEMAAFARRHGAGLEAAFLRRYGTELGARDLPGGVSALFALILAGLDVPLRGGLGG